MCDLITRPRGQMETNWEHLSRTSPPRGIAKRPPRGRAGWSPKLTHPKPVCICLLSWI